MRRRGLVFFLPLMLAGGLILRDADAHAQLLNINSEDNFLFDFDADNTGGMSNGTSDAYDSWCYDLTINGTMFAAGGAHEDYYGGRGFRSREQAIGDLHVRRHAYVPLAGPSYARYIDTVRNDGAGAVNVTFAYHCNLGSDGGTIIGATEDGDQTIETADAWAETDDMDNGGDPSLGHVFYQPGAEVTTSSVTYNPGIVSWQYDVAIGAGETAAIMIFGIQQANEADAHADVISAVDLEDPALADVGDEFGYVRNFVMSGAPLLHSGGPYEVDEGSCVQLEASAEDREGDAVTIAWDLDDDGTYETEDVAGEFCATDLDGPSTASVGIIAADAVGNAVERQVAINVLNVDPVVTSAPPTVAIAGGHYEHQLLVTDPGGINDPLTYTFRNQDDPDFPLGLTISPTGVITWDPLDFQAGTQHSVDLRVDDGDDGIADVSWTIDVRTNTIPTTPQPRYPTLTDPPVNTLRPTLITANSTDADGDELTYVFQIADEVGFVSPIESPPLPAGALGATEWTVPNDLQPGLSYYWKVWVTDGIDLSDEGFSSFQVAEDAIGGGGDAGVDDGDGGEDDGGGRVAGCACRITSAPRDASGLTLLLLAGLVIALRRR